MTIEQLYHLKQYYIFTQLEEQKDDMDHEEYSGCDVLIHNGILDCFFEWAQELSDNEIQGILAQKIEFDPESYNDITY